MGAASYVQTKFSAGEWSPTAQGRMEDPRYSSAMDLCYNGMPTEEGSWVRRPGSRLIAPTKRGRPAKVLPFTFTEASPYNMEFTDGNLRMYADTTPTLGFSYEVENIDAVTPAVLTLTEAPGWATGADIVFQPSSPAAAKALAFAAGRQFRVTQIADRRYALYDAVTGENINGADLGWVPGLVVSAAAILDFDSPYVDDLFTTLRSVQSENSALLLHKTVPTHTLRVTSPPAPDAPATFALEETFFQDGPYLDPVPGSSITPNGTSGIITMSLSFRAWSNTRAYVRGDYVTYTNGRSYVSLIDANVGNTPTTSTSAWSLVSPGAAVGPDGFTSADIGRLIRFQASNGNWSWGKITGLSTVGAIPESKGSIWGNMDSMGQAFNGSTGGNNATKSFQNTNNNPPNSNPRTRSVFIGKNFGSAPEQISRVVLYPDPRSNVRFGDTVQMYSLSPPVTLGDPAFPAITIRIRGSNATSQPAYTSGTVLASGTYTNGTNPISINVNNSTSWRWVWVEVAMTQPASYPNSSSTRFRFRIREVQLFSANAVDEGSAVRVMVLGPNLPNINTMNVWRLGAYGGANGYPTCGCYHEGRLWLAGAIPNRFDASVANEPFNFAPTEATGQVTDRSAIAYTLNSSDVNPIFWMVPNAQGIGAGTQNGEWLIAASAENNVLTPTSIQAHRVTRYGCANAEPRVTGLSTVFIQTYRRSVIEFISDAYSGKFFGPNLSEFAKHLTANGIVDLASQDSLSPIVWGQKTDGKLIGVTYRRVSALSSDEPKFLGWHQHEHGGGRVIESMCVGPTSDGLLDTLVMVTKDPETPVRHMEFLTKPFPEDGELHTACQVDAAIVPATGEFLTVNNAEILRFYGLWAHNNKKVAVWAAGVDCGDFFVKDGTVDVPIGSGDGLFTRNRIASLSNDDLGEFVVPLVDGTQITAVVGFPFVSRGRLLRPVTREASGARNGPGFAKVSRTHTISFLLYKAQGFFFGTSFGKMLPALFRTPGGKDVPKTELFSGLYEASPEDDYDRNPKLAWEIRRPYPATVLAVGGFIHTQDE